MLTQCPECKTTFRLHVNQLKAAAGKVRCSRCHTTFDALDNLVEAPLPVEEPSQAPPPEERSAVPESGSRDTRDAGVEPLPSVEAITTIAGETTGSHIEQEIEFHTDTASLDTLSAFIEELEESTANSDEAPLPLVGTSTTRAVTADEDHENSAAIDETLSHESGQWPPADNTSSQHTNLITTALDFIDDMPSMEPAAEAAAALPGIEAAVPDMAPDETAEELFAVEPDTAEPGELEAAPDETAGEFFTVEPIADEAAELDEAPDETTVESFTVEPVAAEPAARDETVEEFFSVEPIEAELDEMPDETVEDFFTVEAEPAERSETPDETVEELFTVESAAAEPAALDETVEEFFSVEPIEAELDEVPDETVEEFFSVEPIEAELDEMPDETVEDFFTVEAEPAERSETPDETVEELFTVEPVAAELDEEFADSVDGLSTDEAAITTDEPLISDEELDSLFDESEPVTDTVATETLFDTATTSESGPESAISEADLDSFFDEPVTASSSEAAAVEPEQDDLLSLFDEEPADGLPEELDDGAALEAVTLPEEPPAPRPSSDPLIPFSEEQLESMLSPSEEQVAEEAAVSKVSLYAPEELDLDTGEEGPEELTIDEEERPQNEPSSILTDYTVPTAYAMPAELAPDTTREGSAIATMLWGLGILLMCATLVLQYLYYHRLQLVENPQLRPVLATLCDLTGCQLPPQRDLGRIELTEHLVQFHPNYEQSLLISATLANRADFDQPYPLVEVVMTDIEQRVVAHRRFTPAQYLPNHQGGGSFPANSEVPLLLEVLDPGNEAVGFEFRFY